MAPWIIGLKKTKELLYTVETINAQEAECIGMVNRVVALEELESETEAQGRKLSRVPVEVFRLTKASINRTYEIVGLQPALQNNADLGSILHAAGESEQIEFLVIASESVLKTTFEWSKRQFSEWGNLNGKITPLYFVHLPNGLLSIHS
jgi:enoyl-CoA hydratase